MHQAYRQLIKAVLCTVICTLLSFSAFSNNAYAADAKPPGSFFSEIGNTAKQIVKKASGNVTKGLYDAGMGFAAKLTPTALAFGGSIALVYLFAQVIKAFAGQNSNLLDVIFDIAVPMIIAASLINSYDARMGQFNIFLDILRNVAPDPLSGLAKYYGDILSMIEKAVTQSLSDLKNTSFMSRDIVAKFLDVVATLLFSVVILFIAIGGLAEVLGLLLMGPFLFAVGCAFGPMFIATIVVPWTRDYFGKWLGFLVGAALLTGVVGVVIAIAATCLGTLDISSFTSAGDGPISITLAVAGIMIMAVNSLIAQAPAIASAMIPGSIGASKGVSQAIRDTTNKGKEKTKQAGKDAANVIKSAKNRMMKGPTPNIGANLPKV